MKHLLFAAFGVILAGCASSSPPPAAHAETTSANLPREAFTPPGEWEMTIQDKPDGTDPKLNQAPATRGQADTTAAKRQSGTLVTLPSNTPAK